MTDDNQHEINHNLISRGLSVNLFASRTRTQSVLNSGDAGGVTNIGYAANITKADFNRDVNVDIHSITGERVQARHYEIPEAIAVNGDENKEHPNNKTIVDARPLPWYIRIEFWKLCVIAILIVSAFVVAIVLLSTNLHSPSITDERLPINPTTFPTNSHNLPTSFPTNENIILPSYEPSFKPSSQSDKEYIAMQRSILEQIYIETDGGNSWYTSENWLNDDVSVCKWYGCGCNDMDNKIVTSFSLQNFKLPHQVPTVIGMLSKLEVLNIAGGNIVGTLPSELFHLHQLKNMTVVSSMEGMFSSEIGNLRSLEYLELRENSFDGQIPTELGLLQSLKHMFISDHEYFTESTIPSEIGNMSSLQTLYMSRNGLRGTVPPELFGLVSLEEMNLSWNSLRGSLPLSMELISLREMDLSHNKLTGMLPGALGSLKSLEVLQMDFNKLTSIEPGLLSNGNETLSSRLSTIDLYFNKIDSLPTNYVMLPSLSSINIAFNNIEGSLPMFKNVAKVLLTANQFTGSIPTEYGLLGNLTHLHLEHNFGITGTVPTELMECDKLSLLAIYDTGISGNITLCSTFGNSILVRVSDLSLCEKECECCCAIVF